MKDHFFLHISLGSHAERPDKGSCGNALHQEELLLLEKIFLILFLVWRRSWYNIKGDLLNLTVAVALLSWALLIGLLIVEGP